jgi:hypothetical protein
MKTLERRRIAVEDFFVGKTRLDVVTTVGSSS